MRLGHRQLARLRSLSANYVQVVACPLTRSLTRRGLLAEAEPGGFVHITAAGLRALADAADAGRISLAPDLEAMRNRAKS